MTKAAITRFRSRKAKSQRLAETPKLNFAAAITNLQQRAKTARRVRSLIAVLLLILISSAAGIVFLRLTESDGRKLIYSPYGRETRSDPNAVFLSRVDQVLSSVLPDADLIKFQEGPPGTVATASAPPSSDAIAANFQEANQIISMYERVEEARTGEKPQVAQPDYSPIVSTIAFSAGAVAFVILAIQIAVLFMRYYAQLAELYDAQAGALEASGGDVEIAIKFMESFSPKTVVLGKAPTTLYEKALDTISDVAKAKIK